MISGSLTGATTPRSGASPRPFILSYTPHYEHTFLIPTHSFLNATQLKDQFIATLPSPSADHPDEFESTAELVARFMGFVVEKFENDGEGEDVLLLVVSEFETRFLRGNEVHGMVSELDGNVEKKKAIVRAYYSARILTGREPKGHESALLRAITAGDAKTFLIFGGQGYEGYFDELTSLYSTYSVLLGEFIQHMATHLLQLSQTEEARKVYDKGLDIMSWILDPQDRPDGEYLCSAPVSLPCVGVVQLALYAVTCRILGKDPGSLRQYFSGATGHSQGIVTAVAVAASSDWKSFLIQSRNAVTTLFRIGLRSQMAFPVTTLPPSILADALSNNEGNPSPMLSIRDLSVKVVNKYVEKTNSHLPEYRKVGVSLVNGPRGVVVVGPPGSLHGLNLSLRKLKAPQGLEQGRVPHSERKLRFTNRFLPISCPFHSKYLQPVAQTIIDDLEGLSVTPDELTFPVFATDSGKNLQDLVSGTNIVPLLVDMITHLPVRWEQATHFPGATHIIDFGPGGLSGLGSLTHRNKDGTGVRIIIAGSLEGGGGIGGQGEIFERGEGGVRYNVDWVEQYRPRLIKTKDRIYVSTKFSRLIGKPPLMVAGMTPCTVHPSFVIAAMNAGYQIELAGGGYFAPHMMEAVIREIVQKTPPGAGVCVNAIYINPRLFNWQMDLVKSCRAQGVGIEGVTIGAGVPSLEVANELITSFQKLGVKYLALKPGSTESLGQTVAIARAHPTFPILCQWTGGRAGGHHSFEDFHSPILSMYSTLRRCSNIILIAGSGFGGSEDTEPYLTGEWALKFAHPCMPFDGVLFGSRVMTALEARTSLDAKQAIVDAPGLDDEDWEKTYKGPAGGVITVRSELGEPIHKLATRGVMFWKELDDTIFNIPKDKLPAVLKNKKSYIIKRLNADFQKPWFGKNSKGDPVDLEDMTYAEVLNRMLELMFVAHEKRWIDVTLRDLTGDFIRRLEERFTHEEGKKSVLQSYSELEYPYPVIDKILEKYPEASQQLLNSQDIEHFLFLCGRFIQKPVPFIPILDKDFQGWFKRDSLWQSEDLEAVVGRDVGRVCILQGPMAAKHSTKVNQPIKEIFDNIHEGHIASLKKRYYDDDESKIPLVEYFGGAPIDKDATQTVEGLEGVTILDDGPEKKVYKLASQASGAILPDEEKWIQHLAGEEYSWKRALFTSDVIIQGKQFLKNNVRSLFVPRYSQQIEIDYPDHPEKSVVTIYANRDGKLVPAVQASRIDAGTVQVAIFENRTARGELIKLPLLFKYLPGTGFAPIQEVMEGRNDRIKKFYWQLWFGSEPMPEDSKVTDVFKSEKTTVDAAAISEFCHSVGNRSEAYVEKPGKQPLAPMDFAIVVGWKSIIQAIFPKSIDGDLLKLVHLSNGFRMAPGARPLKTGDVVSTSAQVTAIINNDSGKMVEVQGEIFRDNKPVMEVKSQFLYRGEFKDFENTFQKSKEIPVQVKLSTPKDVAVLRSKEWFHPIDDRLELLNTSLTFRLYSIVRFKNKTVFSSVETSGSVWLETPTKEIIQVAAVEYECGESHGNPVIDYLKRHGTPIEQPVQFENGGYSVMPDPSILTGDIVSPPHNTPYASVSSDFNPIHVNPYFAKYASLPGTITHGMWTSAATRKFVETFAAENHPERVTMFDVKFMDMVLPSTRLETKLAHTGMVNGKKIIKVETFNIETGTKVIEGTAEVDQPVTAYVFTGQGSQEQGMGMDLYESSAVARAIWDRADEHFLHHYGFSIVDIVRNNPKELTVYFGGPKGKAIRQNYLNMVYEQVDTNGLSKVIPIFKGIDENSTFYKFVSPTGLLSATQFTQPALTLMEKAAFEDMKAKGLVQRDCAFAGHSLGEYSALAAIGDVLPIESLVDIVFYRGLTMQVAVSRDAQGRSEYGMVAANPSRVSPTFNETALRYVVDMISSQTGWLLEIVNFNVENSQYVCAGHLNALDCLGNVLNFLKQQKIDMQKLMSTLSLEEVKQRLSEIVTASAEKSRKKAEQGPIELERGYATIPLKAIDVPFHSTFLRNGVRPFRGYLSKKILRSQINPSLLLNRYIPNVTAKPFNISREYIEEVHKLTGSPKLANVLNNWSRYQQGTIPFMSRLTIYKFDRVMRIMDMFG